MAPFDDELRACITELLGAPAPVPEGEPLLFFRQWLAERNLGLVPIADADEFDWPGKWLARVRASDGAHAVVMFGSPSGSWLDPGGVYGEDATIEAGWMLSPLDLELDAPWSRETGEGSVAAILLAPRAEAPLASVEEVDALAGRGLEGDRYEAGQGTFSGPGRGYQLTLVEAEVLDEIELAWPEARRNVVTRDIRLNGLVGRRFRVGSAQCVGRRLCEPCAHLEKLARPGLLRPLVHRGGLRADILADGLIRVGDPVVALD